VSDPTPDGIDKERRLDPRVSMMAEGFGGCGCPGSIARPAIRGAIGLPWVAYNFKILLTAIGRKSVASARFVYQEDHAPSASSGFAV
jgi:hypothetical protein